MVQISGKKIYPPIRKNDLRTTNWRVVEMKNSKEFSDLLDPVFQLVGGRSASNFA